MLGQLFSTILEEHSKTKATDVKDQGLAMKNHGELVHEHLRKYYILLQPVPSQLHGQIEL